MALAAQAGPVGHTMFWQAAPLYPGQHVHLEARPQVPRELQKDGHCDIHVCNSNNNNKVVRIMVHGMMVQGDQKG